MIWYERLCSHIIMLSDTTFSHTELGNRLNEDFARYPITNFLSVDQNVKLQMPLFLLYESSKILY